MNEEGRDILDCVVIPKDVIFDLKTNVEKKNYLYGNPKSCFPLMTTRWLP